MYKIFGIHCKYHSWYFKVVSNFTSLTTREITYNNCEMSLVVFMPNFTTNHAITFTNTIICLFCFFYFSLERITSEEKAIFEDVIEDFSSIDSIKSRFEEWKNKHEDCYTNAYISLCLPKLFAPFIRLQLLDWNPFEVQLIPFLWTLWANGCGTELDKNFVCVADAHHGNECIVHFWRFLLYSVPAFH